MKKEKVFAILDILETKDKNKIKQAYREKLVHVNPEDNPEGFKALRQAYEEALRLSEEENEEGEEALDTPIHKWIGKIESIYNNVSQRRDEAAWKEIFEEEVCNDFDTRMEARDVLLTFLMDHYRLPKEIWVRILKTFDVQSSKEELYEHFPPAFIDYVTEDPENKAWMNFDLFEGEINQDVDEYIDKYLAIRKMNDSRDYDKAEELLAELTTIVEKASLYHPYLDVEKMRFYTSSKNFEEANRLSQMLQERQYDDLYISYYLAHTSFYTGDLEEAYKACLKILEIQPEHYGAKYLVACYYLEQGDYKKAKEEYLNLLEIDPYDKSASDRLQKANEGLIERYQKEIKNDPANKQLKLDLGWCFCQNDLYKECIKLIKDMVIDKDKEKEIYYDYYNLMSRIYIKMDDYKNAYTHIKIWLEEILKVKEATTPQDQKKIKRLSYAYYAMSQCFYHLGMEKDNNKEEFEKCIKYVDLAIKAEGKGRDLNNYLSAKAFALLKMKDHKRCIDVCDEVLSIDDKYFPAYVYRQESYYHLRMAQEVIDDYYHAIEIYPSYSKPYILAVKVFLIYDQFEEAKGVFKRAEEENVESNGLKYQKLRLTMQASENIEEKREAAKQVEALYHEICEEPGDIEDCSDLFHEVAICYYEIKDYNKALQAIEKRLKLKDDKDSLLLKADILYNLGKYAEAIGSYQKLLSQEDYYVSACYRIGKCYAKMNKDSDAKDHFLKVIEADNEHKYVNDQLMELYQRRYNNTFDKEDYDLAVQYGKRQVDLYPHCYYYNGLGLVYMDGYEFDKAIEAFKEAIKCDETDMYAYNNIGYAYKILGNLDEAYKYYQLAAEHQNDGNLLPYKHLATYYKTTGQYQKAIEAYEEINKRAKNPRFTTKDLAGLYERMQEWDKAIKCYTNLYEIDELDEMEYLLNIGFIYCFTNPNEALSYYKKAVKKYSNNYKPYYHMGDYMLWIEEDVKKAIKYYEKAYKTIKKYNISYYEYIENIQFNLLYALKKLGKQKEMVKYIQELEAFLRKEYGGREAWLKEPSCRKIRLAYLAELAYFMEDYEKVRDYLNKMKNGLNCSTCTYSGCLEYYFLEGLMFELEGDHVRAIEKYEQATQIEPDNLIYQYMLKQMHKKVGN